MASAASAADVTIESLLRDMTNRVAIARFPATPFRPVMFSSYDRRSVSPTNATDTGWFANTDRGKYLRTEINSGRTEYVLMDHQAPGAIVRSWMPDQELSSPPTLRVYLDGSNTPAIEGDLNRLFDGTGLIPPPFAHPSLRSSVSFFPIPYARSCKVTLSAAPFYYIFNCREYPTNTVVDSFSMAGFNALSNLTAQVGQALLKPGAGCMSETR